MQRKQTWQMTHDVHLACNLNVNQASSEDTKTSAYRNRSYFHCFIFSSADLLNIRLKLAPNLDGILGAYEESHVENNILRKTPPC